MRSGKLAGLVTAGGCAFVSAAVFALTSDPLLLAGSTPAAIFGPTAAAFVVQATTGVTAILAGSAVAQGARRATVVGVLALWLAVLAVSTHRVVDGGPDGIRDLWLGVPVTTDLRYAETDDPPHACRAALLPALCFTRRGHARAVVTVLPFERMTVDARGRLGPLGVTPARPVGRPAVRSRLPDDGVEPPPAMARPA